MKKLKLAQFLHTLNYGDAISSETVTISRLLKEAGAEVEIFSLHAHEKMKSKCRNITEFNPSEFNTVLLHYSLGSPLNQIFKEFKGERIFLYHNLTPEHWFANYNRRVYDDLVEGKKELKEVAKSATCVLADSEFNSGELKKLGVQDPKVLSLPFDSVKWQIPENPGISKNLQASAETNILHVGRLAPNKCIEDIIKAFYFYHHKINSSSTLWLIGSDTDCEIYSLELRNMVREFNIKDSVKFVGSVSDEELKSHYMHSDAYLCMSEHEGFCVPLLEAMSFSLPVIAYKSSAIEQTVGKGGALLSTKSASLTAELIDEIVTNQNLRESLIKEGKQQIQKFSLDNFSRELFQVFEKKQAPKTKTA